MEKDESQFFRITKFIHSILCKNTQNSKESIGQEAWKYCGSAASSSGSSIVDSAKSIVVTNPCPFVATTT